MGFADCPARQRAAFTLVELLLTVVLLLLLMGALVFNFSALRQGASLDEGAAQFETLLRLAQAQAAHTGCRVQLELPEPSPEASQFEDAPLRLLWEPDAGQHSGQWQELETARWNIEQINHLVAIRSVQPLDRTTTAADFASGISNSPPIIFHPDGSSDSAEIILGSREPEDTRQVALRLIGITGTITRRPFVPEDLALTSTNSQAEAPSPDGQSGISVRPSAK